MDLILWRHCDAEPGDDDLARPLTAKGIRQAHKMAQWLLPRLPEDCRIAVSPAVRAQQTASALGRAFETSAAIAPGADAQALAVLAGWPDAGGTVLLVGHQPTLGELAARLVARSNHGFHLRKGMAWWLGQRDGAIHAVVKAVMSADLA
ncbi:MAG: histidine phosphatase family protein [Casimicrobiaceae bacterium]